jgi:hypothetical protein
MSILLQLYFLAGEEGPKSEMAAQDRGEREQKQKKTQGINGINENLAKTPLTSWQSLIIMEHAVSLRIGAGD